MTKTTPFPKLIATAKKLMTPGKGLLAMDESNPTSDKRFKPLGIPLTPQARRDYRDLIVTASGLGKFISGAILFDETVRQKTRKGISFIAALKKQGIIPGIKVDAGTADMAFFPGEKISEGLDKLRERLREYAELGLRFAKWRAVITIGKNIPSLACIQANAQALARYAALCQENGIVPVVEPEVLMDGAHTMEACRAATEKTLRVVFEALEEQHVFLEGMILKPNMILPGKDCPMQEPADEIAGVTVKTFLKVVPKKVAGIAFLSGGQSPEQATERLNAMNWEFKNKPWPLTFSFSRAIQEPCLKAWKGKDKNIAAAQKELCLRAQANGAASRGRAD